MTSQCGDAPRHSRRVGKAHHHADRWWARFALPTLIWGLVSQGFRTGLGWIFAVKGRRAEPCVAQRADRAPSVDWLPRIAAAHCITSYPVGPLIRTHIPHACGEEAMRMRPIYAPAWFGPWVARSSSILQGSAAYAVARPREFGFMLSWLRPQELARR